VFFQVQGTVSRNNIIAVSHFYWVSIAGSKLDSCMMVRKLKL